jgi:hypothetical protein
MARYAAFRRQPVDPQVAAQLRAVTLPAPTRGIIQNENEAYMQPGGCLVCDNWAPTLRGVKLRGGCIRHCVLPETTPIISGFEYVSGNNQRMYAANAHKLYDVTAATPVLVKDSYNSGNYAAAQYTNAGGDWILVANDAGDPVLRSKDGVVWYPLDASGTPPATAPDGSSWITGPAGSAVQYGHNLSYVWKYRNHLFFIERSSMNAWYLDIDAVGGLLKLIPLSGSASGGGHLLFGAVWSLDAGDGADDKCVFVTDLGEVLVFTGSNPSDAANWRQEGRYAISPPLGMNAHINVGGDLLILTVDGIIPISQAVDKSAGQLELAMLTRTIKPMWRAEVAAKRAWAWSAEKWDDFGAIFVTTPGGIPGKRYCLLANNATGAWARFPGWDATCFMRLRSEMFFGTQGGVVMQANVGGKDDGALYTATLVGGWETFGTPASQIVWHQARAVFRASGAQPFAPQLSATVDYAIKIPPAPSAGPDPGPGEGWDEGTWDVAHWDADSDAEPPIRNTLWVSIGKTGFAHAPIIQVTVAQQRTPDVELIALTATYEPAGVNV